MAAVRFSVPECGRLEILQPRRRKHPSETRIPSAGSPAAQAPEAPAGNPRPASSHQHRLGVPPPGAGKRLLETRHPRSRQRGNGRGGTNTRFPIPGIILFCAASGGRMGDFLCVPAFLLPIPSCSDGIWTWNIPSANRSSSRHATIPSPFTILHPLLPIWP